MLCMWKNRAYVLGLSLRGIKEEVKLTFRKRKSEMLRKKEKRMGNN
jgi:hypothetical protein